MSKNSLVLLRIFRSGPQQPGERGIPNMCYSKSSIKQPYAYNMNFLNLLSSSLSSGAAQALFCAILSCSPRQACACAHCRPGGAGLYPVSRTLLPPWRLLPTSGVPPARGRPQVQGRASFPGHKYLPGPTQFLFRLEGACGNPCHVG